MSRKDMAVGGSALGTTLPIVERGSPWGPTLPIDEAHWGSAGHYHGNTADLVSEGHICQQNH